MNIKLVILIVD